VSTGSETTTVMATVDVAEDCLHPRIRLFKEKVEKQRVAREKLEQQCKEAEDELRVAHLATAAALVTVREHELALAEARHASEKGEDVINKQKKNTLWLRKARAAAAAAQAREDLLQAKLTATTLRWRNRSLAQNTSGSRGAEMAVIENVLREAQLATVESQVTVREHELALAEALHAIEKGEDEHNKQYRNTIWLKKARAAAAEAEAREDLLQAQLTLMRLCFPHLCRAETT
jgi:hypothetical protein